MTELIRFSEHLLRAGYNYAYGFSAYDLTGNGTLDIITADTDVGIYWLENDGCGNFTEHVIHERSNEWLERHQVVDINGDGRPEIVSVDNINGSLLYFAFDGDPRLRQNWRIHYIVEGQLPGAYDVAVADFDGDGQLEVAASSWRKGRRFDWYDPQSPGDADHWVGRIIEDEVGESRTVCAVDMDGDGRIDLLGTSRTGNMVVWYQNPGDPASQPWQKHIIDTAFQPIHGHPVDMDGDGDVDVVMALGMLPEGHEHMGTGLEHHQIVWYENDGNPAAGLWQKHIICAAFPNAFEAVAADLDNDGQVEVVATAWDQSGRVALFKHRGDPCGPWDMQILKEGWTNANQVIIVDLDGDGRLDILATAERGSNELRWWRNEG